VNEPWQIALDNPTVTLLGFFAKQFNLQDPVWQNTNYVVFPQLFSNAEKRDEKVPEGWGARPSTPRHIGLNAKAGSSAATGWLDTAISGHASAKKRAQQAAENGVDAERTQAERTNEARTLLYQNLSSKPLW